ncbi:olfactory receptor 10A3-like [Hyperolius riggenbachi]|uniref:olfactory receptor 10A3-like n=1 Tax=Hyperolius riggenbachi TaxID=752182 RepID=UPI0035A28DF3
MCEANQTQVTQICLLGFQGLYKFKFVFFAGFLSSYILVLSGNFLIITLVTTSHHLKIPMFIFLKHLAITDILLTTTIVPLMLHIILVDEGILPFIGCIAQLYCLGIFGCVQIFLITAMSYDRYLAICIPLRYASLMNIHVCLQLVVGLWFLGTLVMSSEIIVVCQLHFCGFNYIDHFFCDFVPVVELSTSDKFYFVIQDTISNICIIASPFAFIVITYACISFSIMKISSANGRRKAFSTCSSHLTTVCTYYGTLITVYIVPTDFSSVNINKYRSLLYLVVTPIMNPIIYSLRNREIKRTLLKLLRKSRKVIYV